MRRDVARRARGRSARGSVSGSRAGRRATASRDEREQRRRDRNPAMRWRPERLAPQPEEVAERRAGRPTSITPVGSRVRRDTSSRRAAMRLRIPPARAQPCRPGGRRAPGGAPGRSPPLRAAKARDRLAREHFLEERACAGSRGRRRSATASRPAAAAARARRARLPARHHAGSRPRMRASTNASAPSARCDRHADHDPDPGGRAAACRRRDRAAAALRAGHSRTSPVCRLRTRPSVPGSILAWRTAGFGDLAPPPRRGPPPGA